MSTLGQSLGLGDVLSTTGRVMGGSLPAFFLTALLFTAPAVALDAWLVGWQLEAASAPPAHDIYTYDPYGYGSAELEDEAWRRAILALLVSGLASAFAIAATQAGVLYTVVEHLAGRRAGLGAALAKGIGRLPAALGAVILVSCAVLFSASCFVVPAILMGTVFYFAVPAAVIEDLPPFKAVARSVDLTRGHRPLVLGLVATILVGFAALRWGARVAFGAPGWLGVEAATSAPGLPYFVALGLLAVLEAMLVAVLSSVMYARLRERDGVDVEALAAVFS